MLGLTLETYRELVRLLEQCVPDAEVWAYGSRVSGQAREASDLDLVLVRDTTAIPVGQGLAGLKASLSESNLPILVDVHEWENLPEPFRQEIARQHTVLKITGTGGGDIP